VHAGALRAVLASARRQYSHVVVDVDSAVDSAGDIGLVPDWTTAAAVGIGEADHVVIVVGESRQSQARLWRALPAAVDSMTGRATVVVNRCSDHRRTPAAVAARLGDFLPEASVGWISDRPTPRALAPFVDDIIGVAAR
jgi:hypothetical protein